VLVAGQVTVSLMLLITAGLLIRSFVRLTTTDPGFVIGHLLTGEIQLLPNQYREESRQIQFFDGLRQDLLAVPGVTAVGFTSHLPIKNPTGNVPVWAADNAPANPADRPSADRRVVLPGYFDAVQIPLVSGRDLSARDRAGAPVALVISELMARTLFPGRSPLGQRVMVDNGGDQPVATEVVGVVGNARVNAIGQPPRMTMYLSYYQFSDFTLQLAIRTGAGPDSMVGTVRKLVAARDKEIPVENLVSMEQLIGDSVAPRPVTTVTLGLFSLVAMLLASIGLYGVLAYYVNQRTHEIGVRMSLGADVRRVVGHVVWRSALMVVPGIAVGLAAAFAGGRVLQQRLFEVPPTDPATYATVSAGLAGVALIASVVPAWRAARIDPATALRSE
jgi:putative ABC transport system permease protein